MAGSAFNDLPSHAPGSALQVPTSATTVPETGSVPDHLRPCRREAVHVVPLADDAEGAFAGLDERALAKTLDVEGRLLVSVDERLFLAGLSAEPNDVVSSHALLQSKIIA
jgi:hypothetical protein